MLKKQIYRILFITILSISFIYGCVIYPFEKKQYQNRIKTIEVFFNTIVNQRLSDMGNYIFLENYQGLEVLLRRMKTLDEIIDIAVYDSNGLFLVSATGNPFLDLSLNEFEITGNIFLFDHSKFQKKEIITYVKPIVVIGEIQGFIKIYYSLSKILEELWFTVLVFATLLITILLSLAVIINFYLNKVVISPLGKLADIMKKVKSGDLGLQVPIVGQNEIGHITNTFNQMSLENALMYHQLENLNKSLEQRISDRTKELEAKNIALKLLATTDSLTSLANRSSIDQRIIDELNRALRFKHPFSLILLDIDFFKAVNDAYGHVTGDKVLIEFASILQSNVREIDTVGRWGGEEFLIVCPETDSIGAAKLAESLRQKIDDHEFDTIKNKTASFGVSMYQNGDSEKVLLSRADQALYKAKDKGRNRVEVL